MRDVREVLAEAVRIGESVTLAELTAEQALDALELFAVLRVALAERVRGGSRLSRVEMSAGAGAGVEDRLLTAQDVAAVFGCSVAWVYRQAPRWPFTRKLSHKVLRFSEVGLREWLAKGRWR